MRPSGLALAGFVLASLMVAGLAAGCSQEASGRSQPPTGAPALKVGYIGALTGDSADLGVPARNGVQLAVDEINARGGVAGRPIELVAVDDNADPAALSATAQSLVTQSKVVAVLSGSTVSAAKANHALITGAGVPLIVAIAQEDALVDLAAPGFPLTFRTTEDVSYDVGAITSLLRSRGFKAICVLADNTAHGDGGLRGIEAAFTSKGLAVHMTARHPVEAPDLKAQATQLRGAGCDAMYLHSPGADSARFLKAAGELGWKVPAFGGRGLAAKSFLALAGTTADGLIIPGVVDPAKPAGKAFVAAYDRAFGADDDPAHVNSALGYDSMRLLALGLEQSQGAGGNKLAAAMETISFGEAATGRAGSTLSFSTGRHQAPGRDYLVFYEARGATFKFLTSDAESGR